MALPFFYYNISIELEHPDKSKISISKNFILYYIAIDK